MNREKFAKYAMVLLPVLVMAMALPFITKRVADRGQRLTNESEASVAGGTAVMALSPSTSTVTPLGTIPLMVNVQVPSSPANAGIAGARSVITISNNALFTVSASDVVLPLTSPWGYGVPEIITSGATTTITIDAYYLSNSGFMPTSFTLAQVNLRATSSVGSAQISLDPASTVYAYSNNSDILSSVLPQGTYTVAVAPTPTPIPPTPTSVPPTATPIPPTPTSVPTATPVPPTPTPLPASVQFSVKFQEIDVASADMSVTVNLQVGSTVVYTSVVTTTSNASGVYTGTAVGILPGTYDVYVKGPVHLRKKMTTTPVALNSGPQTFNWSANKLLAGDMDNDNDLQLSDITSIIVQWTSSNTPVTPTTSKYDINGNGFISLSDITAAIINWTSIVVPGD